MANTNFPDPTLTRRFTLLVQNAGGGPSITVRLRAEDGTELPAASFGSDELTGPELTAAETVATTLLTKAKARLESMAVANSDSITWTTP